MAAFAKYMGLFLFSLSWLFFFMTIILRIFEYTKPSAKIDKALLCLSIGGYGCGSLAVLCLLFKSGFEDQRQTTDFETEYEVAEDREHSPTSWVEFYENIQKKARIVFASLIVLPPVKDFKSSGETEDQCAVCLEEFKVGESIQPFPCKHEFHASCSNSWLHAGNITCPLCRLSIKNLLKT